MWSHNGAVEGRVQRCILKSQSKDTPKSKEGCFVQLAFGVSYLVIYYSRCVLGEDYIAWRSCVCEGRRGLQYAYAILPRAKLARYMVCVEPRANKGRGCRFTLVSLHGLLSVIHVEIPRLKRVSMGV